MKSKANLLLSLIQGMKKSTILKLELHFEMHTFFYIMKY